MNIIKGACIISMLCFQNLCSQEPIFEFHGLKIFVNELDKAEKFYKDFLGFQIEPNGKHLKITDQSFPIYIEQGRSDSSSKYPDEARTVLALLVDKLLPAIDKARSHKVKVYNKLLERNGVGIAIPFQDNSGNVISFIEVQTYDPGPISNVRTYNCGVTISDMEKAELFYLDILGFRAWSQDYLPAALPLKNNDGSFAFMIHSKKNLLANSKEWEEAPSMSLLVSTNNLSNALSYLERQNVLVKNIQGEKIIIQDFEGNFIEILQIDK